jgi:hypothetical protein
MNLSEKPIIVDWYDFDIEKILLGPSGKFYYRTDMPQISLRKAHSLERRDQEKLTQLGWDLIREDKKQIQQRLSNLGYKLDLYYDYDPCQRYKKVYPDEMDGLKSSGYLLWIIYDKNDCYSRCGTTNATPINISLWEDERYFVVVYCRTDQQAKRIKQQIRNVVADRGIYAELGRSKSARTSGCFTFT